LIQRRRPDDLKLTDVDAEIFTPAAREQLGIRTPAQSVSATLCTQHLVRKADYVSTAGNATEDTSRN
jgi:hypothetical protein